MTRKQKAAKIEIITKLKARFPKVSKLALWEMWEAFGDIVFELLSENKEVGIRSGGKLGLTLTKRDLKPRKFYNLADKKMDISSEGVRVYVTLKDTGRERLSD